MRSDVCLIEKGSKDLAKILSECEKVAVYNELDHKQSLHLRLLCEELDGMLPELVGNFEGKLWIDFEDGVCKVNVSVEIEEIKGKNREELLGLAKNKKNAAAVGIVGKIRSALEGLFLNEDFIDAFTSSAIGVDIPAGCYIGADYTQYWSLTQYKKTVKDNNKTDAWDELEKSVIATIADDVVVGVKGKKADIVITKKFA